MEIKKFNLSFYTALVAASALVSTNTLANNLTDDFNNGGEVQLFTKHLPALISQNSIKKPNPAKLEVTADNANAITPVCPTLSTNALYTLTGIEQGTNPCYHFEITETSKTTALLVDQAAGTNIDLSIIRHNPDDSLTLMGSSNNSGNTDEVVKTLTEPGHYYWFMTAVEASNASVSFGASVATQLDEYEFNDTVAASTILSDKQHHITGNMDASNDVDYFQFTAVRGQDVIIKLEDNNLDEWIIELFNSGWVPLAANSDITLSNLQPNQVINVRIRPNLNAQVNPANNYKLIIGSKVVFRRQYDVTGESNVNRIPYSSFNDFGIPYATTQAYKKVTWEISLSDSTNHPVEGALAQLYLLKSSGFQISNIITDENGEGSQVIDLGTCSSSVSLPPFTNFSRGYRNTWEADFEYGYWSIDIPNTGDLDLGVGDPSGSPLDNASYVTVGHICNMRLVSSVPS